MSASCGTQTLTAGVLYEYKSKTKRVCLPRPKRGREDSDFSLRQNTGYEDGKWSLASPDTVKPMKRLLRPSVERLLRKLGSKMNPSDLEVVI